MSCAAIAEAKNNLPKLVHEAENGRHIELSRHGKSVAVIISFKDYITMKESKNTFSASYRDFRRKWQDFYNTATEKDLNIFEALRCPESGRTVEL